MCIPVEQKLNKEKKIRLVLDGIQDPGNMGTIIRLADWFGIEEIVCSDDTVDFYNPKVIQASMGSFTRVNIVYTTLSEFYKIKVYLIILLIWMEKMFSNQIFRKHLILF